MKTILLLGAGRVGSFIARRLSENYKIIICDPVRDNSLRNIDNINYCIADDYLQLVNGFQNFNLIVNALPSKYGKDALHHILKSNVPCVDISFMNELPQIESGNGRAVVDCGVAPGVSNMIVAYEHNKSPLREVTIAVGGLPIDPVPPYYYEAPFCPEDVLQEYIRPARIKQNNKARSVEALSEFRDYECSINWGYFVGGITDGLRTLLDLDIPNMREYTLRHWAHWDVIQSLRQMGFLDSKCVRYTSKILSEQWKSRGPDFTLMFIDIKRANGSKVRYNLYDKATDVSSMARTTGLPAIFMAEQILEGNLILDGLVTPEQLVMRDPKIWTDLSKYLRSNGIKITP